MDIPKDRPSTLVAEFRFNGIIEQDAGNSIAELVYWFDF
jgi:hypothetical protein